MKEEHAENGKLEVDKYCYIAALYIEIIRFKLGEQKQNSLTFPTNKYFLYFSPKIVGIPTFQFNSPESETKNLGYSYLGDMTIFNSKMYEHLTRIRQKILTHQQYNFIRNLFPF